MRRPRSRRGSARRNTRSIRRARKGNMKMEEVRMKMSKEARRTSKKTASKMEDGEYLCNSNLTKDTDHPFFEGGLVKSITK